MKTAVNPPWVQHEISQLSEALAMLAHDFQIPAQNQGAEYVALSKSQSSTMAQAMVVFRDNMVKMSELLNEHLFHLQSNDGSAAKPSTHDLLQRIGHLDRAMTLTTRITQPVKWDIVDLYTRSRGGRDLIFLASRPLKNMFSTFAGHMP